MVHKRVWRVVGMGQGREGGGCQVRAFKTPRTQMSSTISFKSLRRRMGLDATRQRQGVGGGKGGVPMCEPPASCPSAQT